MRAHTHTPVYSRTLWGGPRKRSIPAHQEGLVDLSETKWADVSLIKCASYCFLKKYVTQRWPGLSHAWHDGRFDVLPYGARRNVFPIGGRREARDGTCMLPFEMMHQEENINKCLPPSTFKPPPSRSHRLPPPTPALQKATASHVTHYQGGTKHVFGIKPLRALSNKIHFLIGFFHNIYILPFFFPGGWVLFVCWVSSRGVSWR